MKKVLIIGLLLILAILFGSCGNAPVAELDSWDGKEKVITEDVITERPEQRVYTVRDGVLVDITEEMDVLPEIVWDNVPTETWD